MTTDTDTRRIDLGYKPREWQKRFHLAPERYKLLVIHRRAGKSYGTIAEQYQTLLSCNHWRPQGFYIANNYASAERIAWEYAKDFSSPIPGVRTNEKNLRVRVPLGNDPLVPTRVNSASYTLLGAENYDAARGIYIDSAALDEHAYGDEEVWDKVLYPALQDRGGKGIVMSTPNGKNHFYDMYQRALKSKNWYVDVQTVYDTGVFTLEQIEEMKLEMTPEAFEQEMMCSFDAQVKGSYYKDYLIKAREDNRMRKNLFDPELDVHVSFDLGMSDSTSLWFFQISPGGETRFVDYYEDSGKGLEFYVKYMREKPYVIGEVILPHDVEVRELGTGKSRLQMLHSLGLRNTIVLPRTPVDEGIQAARTLLARPTTFFDMERCEYGLSCLESYRRQWNDKLSVFSDKPLHDYTSHSADCFRYAAQGINRLKGRMSEADRVRYSKAEGSYDIYDYDAKWGS